MAKGTKKPTGITISRESGNYTVSWKIGDKNYSKGQQFEYRINGGSWVGVAIGTSVTSKVIELSLSNYYPTTATVFSTLEVHIRGKKKKGKWSDWASLTYKNNVPDVPSLEEELDSQQSNKTKFTWNETTETSDTKPFTHVRWESILVKDNDITDGSKLIWNDSQLGWQTGTGSSASSETITEDTTLLANDSYTRWFRVCGRGAGGASAWRYARHVYARPHQAEARTASVATSTQSGMTCYAEWTASQPASHPIDQTTVQYLITVPDSNLACPSGAQWSDADISADTAGTDAVRFSVDDVLDKDECLFIRINTIHDSNITYGVPQLTSIGHLKDPSDLSYNTNNSNHTLTNVSVDNNSEVPDAFIVLVYKSGSNPNNEIPIGIIPHGASSPLVTPVQCPDWSTESTFTIGAYAAVGTYSANTGLGYTVKAKMRSASTIWVGGTVPVAPNNVNATQSDVSGSATVTWDWTWTDATHAQLSWTDHDDAWESTDEPEIYTISQPHATKWNISGLEMGKKWYIAVRLVKGNPEDDTAIFGPWSALTDITLSSVPNVPTLQLSSYVITAGEKITASWDFVSNDGTGQIAAEVKDEDGNIIAHTKIAKAVVINTAKLGWEEGEVHSLSVRVTSESQRTTAWSSPVSVVIAEALDCSISSTSLKNVTLTVDNISRTVLSLTAMPLTVALAGLRDNVTATLSIRRTENYQMDRPDESEFEGFAGEIVYVNKNAKVSNTIQQEDLLGYMDDEAKYAIVVMFQDVYGQVAQESIEFEVHWSHQAIIPSADVSVDQTEMVAFITPLDSADTKTWTYDDLTASEMGNLNTKLDLSESTSSWDEDITYAEYQEICDLLEITYEEDQTWDCSTTINERLLLKQYLGIDITFGDTCDIYRLSADRPELIVKDAEFGTQYVDPYPAIGEFGGHRFVFKTVNGDYITEDNDKAWTDTGLEEGDILESERAIIDFDGNQLLLYYNVDVGHQWDKDFQQTKYLGGSIQGDWNAGVSRSGSISATMITLTEAEQIRMMRELAVYTGVCHVRTADGSSYTADVQVSEDRDHDDYGKLASFSLTVTRVDAETLDGLTYEQWAQGDS